MKNPISVIPISSVPSVSRHIKDRIKAELISGDIPTVRVNCEPYYDPDALAKILHSIVDISVSSFERKVYSNAI